jgi:hypothetical protein
MDQKAEAELGTTAKPVPLGGKWAQAVGIVLEQNAPWTLEPKVCGADFEPGAPWTLEPEAGGATLASYLRGRSSPKEAGRFRAW